MAVGHFQDASTAPTIASALEVSHDVNEVRLYKMTPAGHRLANSAQLSSMRVQSLIGLLVAAAMLALAAGPPQAAPATGAPAASTSRSGRGPGSYTHMPTPFSDRF